MSDASKAVSEYNDAELDGLKLKVELEGANRKKAIGKRFKRVPKIT